MKRAIIGSRGYRGDVEAIVRNLPLDSIVVSGGAGGVDTRAEFEARRILSAPPIILRADWEVYGKAAGKRRNWPLANISDEVDALWDGWSNGTAHAVTAAVALGKPVRVHLDDHFRPRLPELLDWPYSLGEET